jgi:pantoate--beta-alanine ligase
LLKEGEHKSEKIKSEITRIIKSELAFKIDYLSIANRDTLEEIEGKLEGDILVSIAVLLGKTRLIDNFSYFLPKLHN